MGDIRRFDGRILGLGTESGTRVVLGWWDESPFGPFADAMVEEVTGRRTLVAPPEVAEFVATTYGFDRVLESPVRAVHDDAAPAGGTDDGGTPAAGGWLIAAAGPLRLRAAVGRRTALGHVLRLVPRRIATAPWFAVLSDPVARLLLDGVRTRGSAGNGRRESYGATDVHAIVGVRATWDGVDLGALADVDPPVRFGFGSTPRRPSLTRVTTTVRG
ncbi:hypothetical protein [Isoptericola chiayiensis]|uniref:hypothetical protein n=1 Tax=Isoptericola chiayiensis TaxID=579446 RepID=UPI001552E3B3|nr:hypothetical protein [Isoptericola chiayiensis]NOV99684.1 hypothetical protein [Isoptericola chiayiensis]